MEGPTDFDVWIVVKDKGADQAKVALASARPGLRRTELLLEVNRSRIAKSPILLASHQGYSAAMEWAARAREFAEEAFVIQSESRPEDRATHPFCPLHQVYFGGCLGCHVCRGFYVP